MRRNTLLSAVTGATLAAVMLWPAASEAQRRHPAFRPVRRPPVVAYRGYYGYPFFGAYRGFYPWYRYPYFAYPQGYYWPAYHVTSTIRLQVTPKEAQVYVDGHFVGQVQDFDGTFERLRLQPGQYELVLYLEGYRSVRQKVLLQPAKELRIRYDMTPLPPGEPNEPRPLPAAPPAERQAPSEYGPPPSRPRPGPPREAPAEARDLGTLAIRVQPADAEVLIDGERWRGPDQQDRLVIRVSEGVHRVEIQKAGYLSYSTEVRVRRGETTTLNVTLPPREPR